MQADQPTDTNMVVIKSRFQNMVLPQATIPDHLLRGCATSNKVAYIDGVTGRTYTFRQLTDAVQSCACALRHQGLKPKEMVLIFSMNNIDYPTTFLGVLKAGGTLATVNPHSTKEELLHHLKDSNPVFIFTETASLPAVRKAAAQYGHIRRIIVFDGDHEGCTSFQEFLREVTQKDVTLDDVVVDIDELALLPYSSGTTGIPKGVQHSHRTILAAITTLQHPSVHVMSNPDDVGMCILPLYHALGILIYIGLSLISKNTVVMLPRFTAEGMLKAIADYKVTTLSITPPVAIFLSKNPLVDDYDTSSLRLLTCGGAPLSADVIDTIQTRLGITEFRQIYGMTEVMATCVTPAENAARGSVGTLLPNNEVRIVSPDGGAPCGVNVDGEVLIRSPHAMLGYHKQCEATEHLVDADGWVHSGDIGHVDENGNLYIVDRLKDLIKYDTHQVSPAELESVLLRHEAVSDAIVVGVPDPLYGELPRAYVVLSQNAGQNKEDITANIEAFVRELVSPHKWLRGGVWPVDNVPHSPSGKLLRRLLRE